jgi:hypothetical protein
MESTNEFFSWIKQNKFLKTVSSERDDFCLIDVAMKAGGADTGVYLKQQELQVRMRRGLTFLQKIGDKSSIEIARQGLPKFFDLEIKEQWNKYLPHQLPITFHNLEKLNGENAQISYSKTVNKWIICSKNVAIAAESLTEAEEVYSNEQRFYVSLHIARHWFNSCLSDAKHVDELKELLHSSTLVGEVCDITENQHIVDNPQKHGLIFFAIVPKTPSGPKTPLCQLPDQAIPIFKKFNLKHVDVGKSCIVNSADEYSKLESFIEDLTKDASPDPFICLSEGSVVYATERSGKVLFLAKIKTTKYRILRRVRELLKNAASTRGRDGDDGSKMRSRFRQDLQKWGYTTPKDISDYMSLLEACDHVRKTGHWTNEKIAKWFINFLHEAVEEIKLGRVPKIAPCIEIGQSEIRKSKKPTAERQRGRRNRRQIEVESSDDEDKAFAVLPDNVRL